MNESTTEDFTTTRAAAYGAEADECVRRNPGAAILIAVGAGLVLGLLVRGLRPEPTPRQRLTHLLEEIEDRLRDAAAPAMHKAGVLAGDGAGALHDGLRGGEGLLRDLRRQLGRIFG